MKRSVKCWAIINRRGALQPLGVWLSRADADSQMISGERRVPCTVTYDDGKPRRRRARRGVARG